MSFNDDLRHRTKEFAKEIIHFYTHIKKTDVNRVLGKQLLRSATSTASNFRAVCRARSDRERYAKLCIVVEEADESLFWLELFQEIKQVDQSTTMKLSVEAEELVKIFASYRKKLKMNKNEKS